MKKETINISFIVLIFLSLRDMNYSNERLEEN